MAILYFASALLVSGYLYINTRNKYTYEKLEPWKQAFDEKPKLILTEADYKPFEYSLLGFSVGALVIYSAYLVCKKK